MSEELSFFVVLRNGHVMPPGLMRHRETAVEIAAKEEGVVVPLIRADMPDPGAVKNSEPLVTERMRIAGFECEAFDRLGDLCVIKKGWPLTCKESADTVDAIYRAMYAARPLEAPATAAYWLIERPANPEIGLPAVQWLSLGSRFTATESCAVHKWTTDPQRAIRFCRKEDGERVRELLYPVFSHLIVTEHLDL